MSQNRIKKTAWITIHTTMEQYRKHPWITIHTVTEQTTAWITIHTTMEQYRKHPWITIHTVTEQTKKRKKEWITIHIAIEHNGEICMDYHLHCQIDRTENTACVHILETPETPCANTMHCTIYTVTNVWRCFCIMNKRVHLNAAKNDEVQFHLNCQNATD